MNAEPENEITVESYFRAGTSRATDFVAEAGDGALTCNECGRPIVKCFVLSDGRVVGGDCAATITGDDSTRQRGEDMFALGSKRPESLADVCDEITFAEEVLRIRRARKVGTSIENAFSIYRKTDRVGARESLGVMARRRIFNAALKAGLA